MEESNDSSLWIIVAIMAILALITLGSSIYDAWKAGRFVSGLKNWLVLAPLMIGWGLLVLAAAGLIILHLSYIPQGLLRLDLLGVIIWAVGLGVYRYWKTRKDNIPTNPMDDPY